jgi:hypothetical protein
MLKFKTMKAKMMVAFFRYFKASILQVKKGREKEGNVPI